jgi:hypothetical protein
MRSFFTLASCLTAGALLLVPVDQLPAQHCVAPGTMPALALRAAGGLERGGEGSARGGTIALHGTRWFVAGEYTDRGWALGRRTYEGLPLPGYMERQHQVLGARAGIVRPLGHRSAVCVSGGYAVGIGLGFAFSGDPELGGAGFDAHRRMRADVEAVHTLRVGVLRLLPAINLGILLVQETELMGDIVSSGRTGYLPVTVSVGVPLGDAITLRPRYNLPRRGSQRGSSYGVDAVVQLGRPRG